MLVGFPTKNWLVKVVVVGRGGRGDSAIYSIIMKQIVACLWETG